MKLINSSGWNDSWLRNLVAWCCEEINYPPGYVAVANFSLAHNCPYRGWARYADRSIRAKVNPLNDYPLRAKRQRGLDPFDYRDAVEVLIGITAHEIVHLERWERFAKDLRKASVRDKGLEKDTEQRARFVVLAFLRRKPRLMAAWGDAGPGPVRPSRYLRLSCPSCGQVSHHARALADYRRRCCKVCFRTWDECAAVGRFMTAEWVTDDDVKL